MRMMFEVQNGMVHKRKRAICHFSVRTSKARKYATVKPMTNVKAQVMAAYLNVLKNTV